MESLKPSLSASGAEANGLSVGGPALLELVQAVLAQGTSFTLRATGSSMFPFIRDGDVVTLVPPHGRLPLRGDVVAFVGQAGRGLLFHRIVGKQGQCYLLKGDATAEVDGWVSNEQILGFVSRVERGGKLVHLGLGRERSLIAWLTLRRLPFPRLLPVWRWVRRTLRACRHEPFQDSTSFPA